MCEFMSFFVSIDGKEIAVGDLRSHSKSAELLGIKTEDIKCRWREAEWTSEDVRRLTIRLAPQDEHTEMYYRASILALYPTRGAILAKAKLPAALTTLDLSGATVPEGLKLPAALTTLYLSGATVPEGLKLPAKCKIIGKSTIKRPRTTSV